MGWVVNATPRPLYPRQWPGTQPEAGLSLRAVWTGAENLSPTGIRSPGLCMRSQLLYRLHYPDPYFNARSVVFGVLYFSQTGITLCTGHICYLDVMISPSINKFGKQIVFKKIGSYHDVLCLIFLE